MLLSADQITELKTVYSQPEYFEEGSLAYLLLRNYTLPPGTTPVSMDLVLCPGERDGYDHWPRVPEQELTLVERLPRSVYAQLKQHECLRAGGDSRWRLPQDVLLPPSPADDTLSEALLADTFALPSTPIPTFVVHGFDKASVRIPRLTPESLRKQLRVPTDPKTALADAPRPCLRKAAWLSVLLKYCASDGKVDDLKGVPLAFMTDGKLRAFGLDENHKVCLAPKPVRKLFGSKMPHWFIEERLESEASLAHSDLAGILHFTPQRVLPNLQKVLPPLNDQTSVEWTPLASGGPSEEWLTAAFTYLADHAAAIKLDDASLQKTPMVPDQFGRLHAMGYASTPLLPASSDSPALVKAITAAGVPLVQAGADLTKAIRAFVDAYKEQGIWRLSPNDLVDTLAAVAPESETEPAVKSKSDAAQILDYLSTQSAVRELKGSMGRLSQLAKLRAFPSISGQLVAVSAGDRHVPDRYELPATSTEFGLLDCGRQDRWLPLYQALDVERLTRSRLLSQILLPRLHELAPEDVTEWLRWLRRELQTLREQESQERVKQLLEGIGRSALIECSDGIRRPATQLYHPDAEFVAPLLGSNVGFPSLKVYRDRSDLWLGLFEAIGMARTPRADDLLAAIDTALSGELEPEHRFDRIAALAEYINEHWETLKNQSVLRERTTSSGTWLLTDALASRSWMATLTLRGLSVKELRELCTRLPPKLLAELQITSQPDQPGSNGGGVK